jgi:protein-disulfide isomerase
MKGLTIAIVLLFVVGGGLFLFGKKTADTPAPQAQEQVQEQPAADVAATEAPTPDTTATETPAGDAPSATATTESTTTEEAPAEITPADASVPAAAVVAPEAPATETPATETPAGTGAQPADQAEEKKADQSLLASPDALKIDVAKIMEDRVLGNPDAPVTIHEYASMTCPHCAHFSSEVLPSVKKSLIDTGKAKLVFHEFPLDKFALKAAMMVRCAPVDKFFDLLEVVFRNQERWIKAEDPVASLAQLGTLAGMDEDSINACVNNAELETALLGKMQEAQNKYELKSTPSFVFNNGAETFSGAQGVEKFEEVVNKLSH